MKPVRFLQDLQFQIQSGLFIARLNNYIFCSFFLVGKEASNSNKKKKPPQKSLQFCSTAVYLTTASFLLLSLFIDFLKIKDVSQFIFTELLTRCMLREKIAG